MKLIGLSPKNDCSAKIIETKKYNTSNRNKLIQRYKGKGMKFRILIENSL